MIKVLYITFLLTVSMKVHTQDYLISFTGMGAMTTFDSVRVENITQNKSILVPKGNLLRLRADYSDLNTIIDNSKCELLIYPNPAEEYSIVEFDVLKSGFGTFKILDLSGKTLAQMRSNFTMGKHSYRLSGLDNGVFIIKIITENYNYIGKIINQSNGKRNVQLIENSFPIEIRGPNVNKLKSTDVETIMQYTAGDRLKFTGISGDYRTLYVDIPTESKTIAFTFISCTDADNINYSVIAIGTQTWMAENLRTTKYKNGTDIPLVTESTAWTKSTTAGYCWYDNDEPTYKNTYGALYNWYSLNITNSDKNVCPSGWHIPTDTEWATLIDYLGGSNVAGNKLKENGIIHWIDKNIGADNSSGFTALPGGVRDIFGTFSSIGYYGYWWSATEGITADAWSRSLGCYVSSADRNSYSMSMGFSVRCLKD